MPSTRQPGIPKPCPRTGELHFFGYGFLPPFLTYHRLDAAGQLVASAEIDVPGATMVHDFAITDRHAVFLDLPITFFDGHSAGVTVRLQKNMLPGAYLPEVSHVEDQFYPRVFGCNYSQ